MELALGNYRVRYAETGHDLASVLDLRSFAFRDGRDSDGDAFDRICRHVMVEAVPGHLVCTFRLLPLQAGWEIGKSYSAQFYGLEKLAGFNGPIVEVGRFCIRDGHSDPDILRIAWAALARFVDCKDVELLFGCSSFRGIEAESYHDAFALLQEKHLAPVKWLPNVKAPIVVRFAQRLRGIVADPKRAASTMPPLLRSYLSMGGWVSDHAVIDCDLDTMHVFTAVEVSAIPPRRARLMRMIGVDHSVTAVASGR